MLITHRRICWPRPDATCLAGACHRCSLGPWKRVSTVRRYARRHKRLPARHRATQVENGLTSFEYGLRHDFFRTPTRGKMAKPERD